MLLFRKSTVLLFDSRGNAYKIIQATKKGKRLWYKKNNWTAKEGSYGKFGKKVIYFAQQADENSITPYVMEKEKLKADENWLEALNESYHQSAKKFKFGLDKYKELISIVVAVMFITIMVLGSVKFISNMDPVEAETIQACTEMAENVAQYYNEGSKANQAIAEELSKNNEEAKEPPK